MNLRQLRKTFEQRLLSSYPTEEIRSFFNLLCEAWLGYKRIDLTLNSSLEIGMEKLGVFEDAIERLLAFEPIQYVIGHTEFYGLQFKVSPDTLIPRPETEELVSWISHDLKELPHTDGTSILDIGTGSGCIAISLARQFPEAMIAGLDISEKALDVARLNSAENGVKVEFFQQDILLNRQLQQSYNVIVSNPPYVREIEKPQMQPNVLRYEPPMALFVSEDDPLLFYRSICRMAKKYLSGDGYLYFEINEYLGEAMISLLTDEGFSNVLLKKDFRGKDRMIKCTTSGETS